MDGLLAGHVRNLPPYPEACKVLPAMRIANAVSVSHLLSARSATQKCNRICTIGTPSYWICCDWLHGRAIGPLAHPHLRMRANLAGCTACLSCAHTCKK